MEANGTSGAGSQTCNRGADATACPVVNDHGYRMEGRLGTAASLTAAAMMTAMVSALMTAVMVAFSAALATAFCFCLRVSALLAVLHSLSIALAVRAPGALAFRGACLSRSLFGGRLRSRHGACQHRTHEQGEQLEFHLV